jgi:3',5'-cyclic-AMP phosphodiesterase
MRILDIAALPFWEIPYRLAGPGRTIDTAVLPLIYGTVDVLPKGIEAMLACSDLQGRGQPRSATPTPDLLGETLTTELALLAATGEIPEPQRIGILLLGDFYADPHLQGRGVHGNVGAVWRTFAANFRWVLGVAGNHDIIDRPPVPGQTNAHLFDGDIVMVDGLRVGGVSGIIGAAKVGRAWRRDEISFMDALNGLLRTNPDILLLHQGPDTGTPARPGHPTIRGALEHTTGVLTLCGHVHWPSPLATLPGGNQVLNVDGRAVLLRAD